MSYPDISESGLIRSSNDLKLVENSLVPSEFITLGSSVKEERKEPVKVPIALIKPLGSAKTESILGVEDYLKTLDDRVKDDLTSNASEKQPLPFEYRASREGDILFLPANIKEIDRLAIRHMIQFAKESKMLLMTTDQISILTPETSSEKEFFYGFFKLLNRKPFDGEHFHFNFDSTSAKGAAQAKLFIMSRSFGRNFNDVVPFLPAGLYSDKGTKKIDLELNAMARSSASNISILVSTFNRIIVNYLKRYLQDEWIELAATYRVQVSAALEGLHKTKQVKEKGKLVTKPKKPSRPSRRIEVLSDVERNILITMEKPFDDYSFYLAELGKELEVRKIKEVRDKVSKLINEQWKVVEKTSATITKRKTYLTQNVSDSEKKKLNFNKSFVSKTLDELSQYPEKYIDVIRGLSPKPLLIKIADHDQIGELSRIEYSGAGVVIPEDCNLRGEYKLCFDIYIKMFNLNLFKETKSNKKKDKKRPPTRAEILADLETFDEEEIQPVEGLDED